MLPIVAVDVDGTMSEYHVGIANFACNYHNVPPPTTPWNGHGDHEAHMGLTQAQYREAKLAYRQGGYKRTAQLQPGAFEFMQWLKHMPVEIWITTTRPWNRLDSVDPDTRFWLDRHGFRYDHILYDDHKYPRLAEIVSPERVIGVVEDLPPMAAEALTVFNPAAVMLIQRTYNWPPAAGEYVRSFIDAMRYIEANLRDWEAGTWKA